MHPNEIFLDLLMFPNSARPYKRISKHYHDRRMFHESAAFVGLLKTRFNIIYDPTDDTDIDTEQQRDGGTDTGIFEGT